MVRLVGFAIVSFCVFAAAPGGARAEDPSRAAVVTVTGGVGLGSTSYAGESIQPRKLALFRASFAWTVAPPALPARRGYAWRAGLAPELSVALLEGSDDRARLVTGGLRLEGAFAQREMGLLRASARGSVWLAGRLGALRSTLGTDPAAEVAAGWTLHLGQSPFLVGGDLGLIAWPEERRAAAPGEIVPHGSGERPMERSPFLGFHAGLFVGASL